MIIVKADTAIIPYIDRAELINNNILIYYTVNGESIEFLKVYGDNKKSQKAFNKIGRAIKFRRRMVQL